MLTLTRIIPTTAKYVYRALTNQDWLTCWLADGARTRAAVGGHIWLTFFATNTYAVGEFTDLVEAQAVSFTWRRSGETANSTVKATLQEQGGAVALTLTHDAAGDYETFWNKALDNLVSMFGDGADLRVTQRVLLGIRPDAVSEADAAALGIKPANGVRVGSTIEGLSAARAGLTEGDIILGVNGQTLSEEVTLFHINSQYKAGDEVQVEYARNGERVTVPMVLMGYPIPEMPSNYAAMVAVWSGITAELSTELDQVFAGVSEAQAAHKPTETEWSANEVLAHLILNERWLHGWLGGWMQDGFTEGYSCNTPARIAGITRTHVTNAALVAELKRCWAETAIIMETVPTEFHDQPSMRWWFHFEVDGLVSHTRQHFEQMRRAIQA